MFLRAKMNKLFNDKLFTSVMYMRMQLYCYRARSQPYRKFVSVHLANQRQCIDQNDVMIIISRWRFTEV